MNGNLDQHEDGGTESTSNEWGHDETSENGTKTRSLAPTPFNLVGTNSGNTDTSNRGNQRVCGGNVCRVDGTPHDPDGGTGRRTGESEKLDTSVVVESLGWNTIKIKR